MGQQDRIPVLNASGGTVVHVGSLDGDVQYKLVTYDDPVSYTHLDVYKRQPISPATGSCCLRLPAPL